MNTAKLKEYLRANAEYQIRALEEDLPVRGNAMCSGDDKLDKEVEDKILDDLQWNEWAWCCACVGVKYRQWVGKAQLGACSYESEKDFIENSGYYDDMKDEALDDLVNAVMSDVRAVQVLESKIAE